MEVGKEFTSLLALLHIQTSVVHHRQGLEPSHFRVDAQVLVKGHSYCNTYKSASTIRNRPGLASFDSKLSSSLCPHLSGAKSNDLDFISIQTSLDLSHKLRQLGMRPTAVKYLWQQTMHMCYHISSHHMSSDGVMHQKQTMANN